MRSAAIFGLVFLFGCSPESMRQEIEKTTSRSKAVAARTEPDKENLPPKDSKPAEEKTAVVSPRHQEPPIVVSAEQLLDEYQANEVAADLRYKSRTVEVKGVAGNISKGILGGMYVTLKGGGGFEILSVQCMFDDDFEQSLARVKPGYIYTIQGRCDGKFGNVIIKDCAFVADRAAKLAAEEKRHQEQQAQEMAAMKLAAQQEVKQRREDQHKANMEKNRPEIAQSRLKIAKKFADDGNAVAAKKWLEKVVAEFPGTDAADEAKRLLLEMK